MDKLREKLEGLLKAVKIAKHDPEKNMPENPVNRPKVKAQEVGATGKKVHMARVKTDAPSNLDRQWKDSSTYTKPHKVHTAIPEDTEKNDNKPQWPPESGGKQDHPEHAPFPSNDQKPGDNYGRGTSSDKHSMASGEVRIHKLTAKQSGHGDNKPAKLSKNGQWSLD